jgi:hypothetical protein
MHRNRPDSIRDFGMPRRPPLPRIRFTGRGANARSGSQAPCIKEDDVKELTLEEVLRIAGGLPLPSALDELTYRAPQEAVADPVDYAHLLPAGLRPSEPT